MPPLLSQSSSLCDDSLSVQFLCTVAGNKAASDRAQLRHFAAAALCDVGAARVKTAAGRWGSGAWQLPCQKRLFLKACGWVSLGNGVDEKTCIWVQWCGINLCCTPDFT